VRKISLDQLVTLANVHLPTVLKPEMGEGSLCAFELEEGLKLRCWNFRLIDEIELFNTGNKHDDSFHLLFFLHSPALHLETSNTIQRISIWDTIFFSSGSQLKIIIPLLAPIQCLSISFSKGWLNNNLSQGNHRVRANLKKLLAKQAFCMLECMNLAEKKIIFELSAMATNDDVASFYIKSTVLKIIGDFLLKIFDE
jgi:hypothetical protein